MTTKLKTNSQNHNPKKSLAVMNKKTPNTNTKQPGGRQLSRIAWCSFLVVALTPSAGFADFAVADDNGTPVTATPWLAGVTTNSVYACVDADSTATATVNYGLTTAYGSSATTLTTGSSIDQTELYPPDEGVTSALLTYVHNVNLTGLLPNTVYNYQVTHGTSVSANYTFRTAPEAGKPARFGFAADTRADSNGPTTNHNICAGNLAAMNPKMIIYGGDIAYGSGYHQWTKDWFGAGVSNQVALNSSVPFVNAPGNHEGWNRKESDGGAPHKNTRAFTESPSGTDGEGGEGYFSFDYGDVHILVLNNEIDDSPGSAQWLFAENDLMNSTAKFKIVASHKPAISYGSHNSDGSMDAMATALFEPYGVNFVMAGHNHYYQHNERNGIHYMVVGSFGSPLHVPDPTGAFEVYSESTDCFAIFDTAFSKEGDTLTLRTYRGLDSTPLETIVVNDPGQPVLIAEDAGGWAYLQSLDAGLADVDPAVDPIAPALTPDTDFDETWNDRSSFGYHVVDSYDGPDFTIGATAPFSYGDVGDIEGAGTALTLPLSGTRHTAWFLKEVDGGADGYSNLTLKLLADDGALVYLNGRLIANKNMPLGGDDTWALFSATKGPDGDFDNEPLLNDPVLTPGLTNLLAVSVHQEGAFSSDLGMKLELSGDVGGLPDLAFLGADEITKTTATVRWLTASAGDSTLRYGVDPGVYDTVLNVAGSVTSHEIALSGLTSGTTYFFEAETDDGVSFNPTKTGSFTTAEGPNDINLARGPYLQSASHDRITFWWRTSQLGNSTVRYGTAPESLTSSVTVSGSTKEHTVPVTGLAADTKYYYQLETDNGGVGNWVSPEYFFETSPSPGAKHPTRIWVIGDSGRADRNAKNVYEAFRSYNGQDHTDVWLMLGDNAYESGTQEEYQEAVFDMYPELLCNTPLWSTRGNHDDEGDYFDIFDFPTGGGCGGVSSGTEEYYSFDYGNIHFVCLDSDESDNYEDTLADATPGMADWLQSDLEATTADWIIAFFHHGPYTRGSHNSDGKHHNQMRENTLSILEDYGVDLILSGHSHCYERSHLIDGHYGLSGTYDAVSHAKDTGNGSERGSIDEYGNFSLSGGDGAYQKPLAAGHAGQVSAIVGASGQATRWSGGSTEFVNPNPHPVHVSNLLVLGSMVIDVDGDTLHAVYIDDSGNERDDFTIVKGSTLTATTPNDSLAEGGANSTAFSLTRTGATDFPLTVDYTLGGSANEFDYTPALSGTVSFAIGETSKSLNLAVSADDLAEGAETLTLTLIPRVESITVTSGDRDTYFIDASGIGEMTLADQSSQNWWFTNFGAASLLSTDWEIDHDGDTFDALTEYALGKDPHVSDQPASNIDAGGITFTKGATANDDVIYTIEESDDLGVTDQWEAVAPSVNDANEISYSLPLDKDAIFVRLKVTLAE